MTHYKQIIINLAVEADISDEEVEVIRIEVEHIPKQDKKKILARNARR